MSLFHTMPIQVLFRHCDPAAIVFYPRYVELVHDVVEHWFNHGLQKSYYTLHSERGMAATPHAEKLYFEQPLTGRVALCLGSEQYGLTDTFMNDAGLRVRIPMFGLADSLNVASATTILLFEAVRQRIAAGQLTVPPSEAWHGEETFDA